MREGFGTARPDPQRPALRRGLGRGGLAVVGVFQAAVGQQVRIVLGEGTARRRDTSGHQRDEQQPGEHESFQWNLVTGWQAHILLDKQKTLQAEVKRRAGVFERKQYSLTPRVSEAHYTIRPCRVNDAGPARG